MKQARALQMLTCLLLGVALSKAPALAAPAAPAAGALSAAALEAQCAPLQGDALAFANCKADAAIRAAEVAFYGHVSLSTSISDTNKALLAERERVARLEAALNGLRDIVNTKADEARVWTIADAESKATLRGWLDCSKAYQPGCTELLDTIRQRVDRYNCVRNVAVPAPSPCDNRRLPPAQPIP